MLLRIKVVQGTAEILSDKGGQVVSQGTTFDVETNYISLADLGGPQAGRVSPDASSPVTTQRDLRLRRQLGVKADFGQLPSGAVRQGTVGQVLVETAASRTPENDQQLPGEREQFGPPHNEMGNAKSQREEGQDEQPAPELSEEEKQALAQSEQLGGVEAEGETSRSKRRR